MWVTRMKKHLLLLSFALSALLPVASSLAADLEPPPPPVEQLRPATYDWSGAYVGAWVGAACIDGTLVDNTTGTNYLNAGCGYKGGINVGYNHQIDNIILGVEADWGTSNKIVENFDPTADFSFRLRNIATLRGRVGYAFDDTMIFATAGGAWAQGDLDGIISATPDQLTANHYGWTVGGGMEHAITDNVRIKLDYLYTHLNDGHYSDPCCDVNVKWGDEHEVRLGMNYAF
jgi:outer membrane immunogenic protein